MLNIVEREGASFLRLAHNCLDRERRQRSARTYSTYDMGAINKQRDVLSGTSITTSCLTGRRVMYTCEIYIVHSINHT